jgi:hypothetical protein
MIKRLVLGISVVFLLWLVWLFYMAFWAVPWAQERYDNDNLAYGCNACGAMLGGNR